MATGRGIRMALAAVLVAASIAITLPVSAAEAGETGETGETEPTGPTTIAVPYLGTAAIEPAAGWHVSDCSVPTAATPLVVACDPERIDLAPASYDPGAGATVVPVPLSNGRTMMVFDYVVTLDLPEPPSLAAGRAMSPVASGSVVMVPISDLGVECAVCAEGGVIEVTGVEPAGAGTAVATPTHVVFRAATDFSGEAGIAVRFADDFGSRSTETIFTAPVYRAGAEELVALTVFAPRAASGATSIDLSSLAFATDDSEIQIVGCGAPAHGTVVCGPDGAAEYSPIDATAVDQFSFQVVSANGEHASGSVTLFVADGAGLPTSGPVPASPIGHGDGGVASMIVPALPAIDGGVSGREGVFGTLIGMLDRVGAR